MEDSITIGVDCHGEWIEKNNRFIWRWKGGDILETVAMTVQKNIVYDDFVNLIISYCGLNCQLKDLVISYMHSSFENQRVLPFKIIDQVRLRAYLSDAARPILRVYVVEKLVENHNSAQYQQDMLNDELDGVDMNIPDVEQSGDELDMLDCRDDQISTPTPTPVVASNTVGSSQSSQSTHVQDDETGFYKEMSFKNKEELATSLKMACLKKDFILKKVINSSTVYCFKCAHPDCKWWLRAVKLLSSDRFCIRTYVKYHTCGSEHITSHNPHATAKVIGEYFKDRFPEGKGPSTKDMGNQLRTDLGIKVSYWKLYKGMEIAKSLVRGTHEHGYAVLDAYRYMLRSANPGSKTALKVDENGRFKYFFVSYAAWMLGFAQMRKVIAVDGTFLRSKYEGVLLSAVAQDAEKHIFPVAFCVVDKECDESYKYFFEQMRSFVDDTDELCIISDRHPSIQKMVSIVYPTAHYGCCMRHLGENIRNNFHNSKVVSHFYKAAKAYNIDEFNDHFNQIRDMVPGAAEHLERIGFHRWSRAFCSGNRYNIMTTNIAESVNSMFDVEREFPIVALFNEINRRFAEKFHERRMEFVNTPTIFVPSIEKKISKFVNLGNKLLTHQIANYKFRVTGHGEVATVDLQARSCTCRVFDLDKIPCPHAMAALRVQHGEDFGKRIYEYSSSYYTVERYIIAYCEEIHPVPPEKSWNVPLEILEREIPPPYIDPSKIKPGRRQTKRRRGIGESFSKRKNKCSICKSLGHKRTTCPDRNAP